MKKQRARARDYSVHNTISDSYGVPFGGLSDSYGAPVTPVLAAPNATVSTGYLPPQGKDFELKEMSKYFGLRSNNSFIHSLFATYA